MIQAHPKIFALGTDYIKSIFDNEVFIEEKLDGSQFAFGRLNNQIYMRSKGAMLYKENPEKMFKSAIEYIDSISHNLLNGVVYYCEYLGKPKHNTINYENIPKNNLCLFGMRYTDESFENIRKVLENHANYLNIDVAPLLYHGKIDSIDQVMSYLNSKSYLNNNINIEGIVVKNYHQKFLIGGQPMPFMAGKFVTEQFKEVHRERWNKEEKGKSKFEIFCESFRTEARWNKSIFKLRDMNKIDNTPKDIGLLIKEIHNDIEIEEKEEIKEFLWKLYKQEIIRKSTMGFPEYYKKYLAENNFY